MKNKFFLFTIAFFFPTLIFSQARRDLERAEKKAAELLKGGADFVIDPIETVPEKTNRFEAASQTNWGKDFLLPVAVQKRIANECTFHVTVKVADTGEPQHTALALGKLDGANYTSEQSRFDAHGHSTHVTGIVAAQNLGMCWTLAEKGLLKHKAVKVLADNGSGSFDWVRAAVAGERADDLRRVQAGEAVVWNGSFGGGSAPIAAVEAELKKSSDEGVAFFFAAGNTGGAGVNYPAAGAVSVACGSLDQNLTRSSYSTTGPQVWAAMPGRGINSTYTGQSWATLSGTSMATPFLASAAAIAFSKWGVSKLKNYDRLRAYLAWCCQDIQPTGKDDATGWGVALVTNILDRDPAKTPGLPTDPPPPPPVPGLKGFDPLTVDLSKEVTVNWAHYQGQAAEMPAKTFKMAGRGSRKANQSLATNQVKVRFAIKYWHGTSAAEAEKYLAAALDKYFVNRGFLIPSGQDESWAAIYAGYFFDMHMALTEKKEVNIELVKYSATGGQVQIVPPPAWTWPRK